jgi:beta-glucosidase
LIRVRHGFPESFLWGTATSSHQVEGDNQNNDWSRWEAIPGKIADGSRSGRACGWWSGAWKEDLDRARQGHQNAHRLSIEWSRIEPSPGEWDAAALEHYRQMLVGARERGLQPIVAMHHFTNPLWLAEQGGWLLPEACEWFARYASKVVAALGDLTGMWVTINEPNVYAYAAHASSEFPPGHESISEAIDVMANMARAHGLAYQAIHELQPNAQVGLAHHYRGMQPRRRWSPLDRSVARLRSSIFNEALPRAFQTGVLRLPWKKIPIPEAKDSQDFFGLNYYTREQVAFDPTAVSELFGRSLYPDDVELSPSGFIANQPDGFWEALRWAHSFDLPIYVTENGIEDDEDSLRRRYLVDHVRKLWRAVNFNWRVKGYFHWTLVDNFEWERGWTQRFGLWRLDPTTQTRTKRPSADLYAAICKANALTTDIIEEYVPERMESLFPEYPPGEINHVVQD